VVRDRFVQSDRRVVPLVSGINRVSRAETVWQSSIGPQNG
jgi:hypothetical protein